MPQVSIISAKRTPVGRFLGGYSKTPATKLGSIAISSAIKGASVNTEKIERCLMGTVLQADLGQNPSRQAALGGGLSENIDAMTVNKVCGSGLESAMILSTEIAAGRVDYGVAGGMENMTRAPHTLYARGGIKYGNGELKDHMANDGLTCPFESWPMGSAAEYTAEVFNISRDEQDSFAVQSHIKAKEAQDKNYFFDEIVECGAEEIGSKNPVLLDEGVRGDTTIEKLKKLRGVFKKNGTVTAGNASQISDGAAALILANSELVSSKEILANVVDFNTVGVKPKEIFTAPGKGIKRLLEKNKLSIKDIDLFEINEAFSAQVLANLQTLKINDLEKINICGGGIAIGHPIGASGARVLVTLVNQLIRKDLQRGIVSLCLGGGNAVSMLIERPR